MNGQAGSDGGQNVSSETTPDVITEATHGTNANGTVQMERQVDVKKMKVVFDEKLGRDKPGKRLLRYQENPRENWGPMKRAKGSG